MRFYYKFVRFINRALMLVLLGLTGEMVIVSFCRVFVLVLVFVICEALAHLMRDTCGCCFVFDLRFFRDGLTLFDSVCTWMRLV